MGLFLCRKGDFTMTYVKEREAGYSNLLQSERKGALYEGKANQRLGYDFSLNFV